MKVLNTVALLLVAGFVSAQVGIGTSTPSVPLDIETTDAALDINNTAADGDPKINFQLSGVTTFSLGVDDGDSDKFKIGTTAPDASTALTIDASQNVGIGNTAPTAKLDVDGSAIFNESGAAVDFKIEGDTETELFYVDGSADAVGIGTSSPSTYSLFHLDGTDASATAGPHTWVTTSADPTYPIFTQLNWGHDNISLCFDQYHNGTSFVSSDAGSNFRITKNNDKLSFIYSSGVAAGSNISSINTIDLYSTGNLVINESGQATDFRVEGDTDTDLLMVDGSADRVGISTATPAATLDVEGTFILQNGTSINELSTDGTMAGNSDDAVPTEQAVVEYVAAEQQVLTKTIIIEAPTNTDYFPVFRTDVAITIQEALGMLNAAGDVDVRLYWDSDFAETAPTAIGTTTQLSSTSATTVNISSDATIPADRWVFVDIPEATTAQTVTVNIRYTED